jgi:NAD(P)H-dependent flavin oxidoreductase YrpB (nitropropane dioxygenase family)
MKALKIGNLSIAVPVIQGGMGVGVSLYGLAAAVANEGGVGVISSAGLGLLYKDFSENFLEASIIGLKEEIRKAREKTIGVIGVNVLVAMTNFADMIKTSISEKVDIIIAGAGLPLDLPSFLKKDSITKLVPIVSSARAAKIICEKWKKNYDYLPDAAIWALRRNKSGIRIMHLKSLFRKSLMNLNLLKKNTINLYRLLQQEGYIQVKIFITS